MKDLILLVSPPDRAISTRPPLNLMYISTYLKKYKIDSEIIDIKTKNKLKAIEGILSKVKKKNPKIVGLSSMTSDFKDIKNLATSIKKQNKDIIIVTGGVHATLHPEDFIYKNSPFDFAVIGEGEITFLELIKNIKSPRKVKGISYYDKKFIKTPKREPINLDEIPLLDYGKVNMEFYTKPSVYAIRGILLSSFYIFTSRGCPNACTFCSNSAISGRLVRFRSISNILNEIGILINKYKIDGIYILDDNFTLSKNYILNFCNSLKEGNINILWACQSRVDTIDEEMIKAMKKAGCIQLDFGVESGSQRMLNMIKKNITIKQIKNAFELCRKYKIRAFANFMINLPNETLNDVKKSIKLAKEIKSNLVIFNVLLPMVGCEIYNNLKKKINTEEYSNVAFRQSEKGIEFIEKKFKLSQYTKFNHVLKEIRKEFPSPQDFTPKLNISYFKQTLRELSFLRDIGYIKKMIKSRKKIDYIKSIYEILSKQIKE